MYLSKAVFIQYDWEIASYRGPQGRLVLPTVLIKTLLTYLHLSTKLKKYSVDMYCRILFTSNSSFINNVQKRSRREKHPLHTTIRILPLKCDRDRYLYSN